MLALKLIRALPGLFLLAVAGLALRCLLRGECGKGSPEKDDHELSPTALKALTDATDAVYGELPDGEPSSTAFDSLIHAPSSPARTASIDRVIGEEMTNPAERRAFIERVIDEEMTRRYGKGGVKCR